jgi:hypothetical protein
LDARSYDIPCDGNSFFFFDTLFTICPWWDGPTVRSRIEVLLGGGRQEEVEAVVLGSSCTTRRVADELGRE